MDLCRIRNGIITLHIAQYFLTIAIIFYFRFAPKPAK